MGVLAAACLVGACARGPLPEPAFVESTGSPIATVCITPSAWNCYDRAATRKDALGALELVSRPTHPSPTEEEALSMLRSYLACHPWDLDLTFELARRDLELNRSSDATYLFLRIAENSEDDRAVSTFLRALDALNATALRSAAPECYDEMARRVPRQLARLCSPERVAQHPGRTDECTKLGKIAYDVERLMRPEAPR